jgi:glutaminyl-tRNA synthetase
MPDPAKVRMRFPPEPNGYLHIGHAKSICLNFGWRKEYGGVCHLRFDDTNPEKEEQEYVDSIRDAVRGWATKPGRPPQRTRHLQPHEASNYFDFMYRAAEYLIEAGLPTWTSRRRGNARQPRRLQHARHRQPLPQPQRRKRTCALSRNARRQAGRRRRHAARQDRHGQPQHQHARPALYRIKPRHHHNTGDKWCIYPMYTFAHPIEDALEQITHSICTLEFEDQRPFYDWLLDRLAEGGLIASPHPRQYEFARLNLTYVITSKRKLRQLVEEKPRRRLGRPAHAHHRRPAPPRLHARSAAPVLRTHRRHQVGRLDRLRQPRRPRCATPGPDRPARHGRARPGEAGDHQLGRSDGRRTTCSTTAPRPCTRTTEEMGKREFKIGREVWIERTDYEECSPRASSACSRATRCA